MKKLHSLLTVAVLVACAAFATINPAQAGYYHEMLNPENTPAIAANALPAGCRLLADDITNLKPIYIDCNSVNGLSATPIAGSFTTLAASGATALSTTLAVTGTSTLHAINATGTVAVTGAETVSLTLGVTGVTTATGGLVSSTTNDLSPTFSTGITANPVVMTTKGSCTTAAVNGGTCIPLVGVASRTITVTHFDIVAAGSAATCTGILLEDTNGTPVVIATLAAAQLTSAAHNIPLTATLGVGFGAGSGLTVAKGVQIIKNGSDCATTTSFAYTFNYTIQ